MSDHRLSSRELTQGPAVSDRPVFWGLLALLAWAPIPLGSNRTLAAAVLVVWAVCLWLGTLWCWRQQPGALLNRLWTFRWPLLLFVLWVALIWAQVVPWPSGWLSALSPEAASVQLGVPDWKVPQPRISLDPSQTRFYAALSVGYLCVFVVLLVTVRDHRRMEQLALALVVIGVAQAVLSVLLYSLNARYQLFFFDVVHDRAKGTMSYHNHFAGYMEMCLAMGVGLMLARLGHGNAPTARRTWRQRLRQALEFMLSRKMRLRLMLVVMVIALVLTRSRMGNAGFFAGLLVVGLLMLLLTRRSAPAMVALVVSLIVVDVVVIGTWVGLERVVARLQETSLTVDGGGREESVELRQQAAIAAVDLVRDFPLLGTGSGSFYANYPRYRSMARAYFDHAHNDYVELAADHGLLGLLLLGALVASTAGVAAHTLARRRSGMPRGMAFGVLLAIAAIAIHSTVDFNLQLPANALTMVAILACGWAAWALPRGVGSGGGAVSPRLGD